MRWTMLSLLLLAACAPLPPDRGADICEAKVNEDRAPRSQVTVGVNSNSGGFINASIDFSPPSLAETDPEAAYRQCVVSRTGQPPIRPLILN